MAAGILRGTPVRSQARRLVVIGTHTFSCGPLSPIPTRWFRATASESLIDFAALTKNADLVLEVFTAPCTADAGAAPLGCNDNTTKLDL